MVEKKLKGETNEIKNTIKREIDGEKDELKRQIDLFMKKLEGTE